MLYNAIMMTDILKILSWFIKTCKKIIVRSYFLLVFFLKGGFHVNMDLLFLNMFTIRNALQAMVK